MAWWKSVKRSGNSCIQHTVDSIDQVNKSRTYWITIVMYTTPVVVKRPCAWPINTENLWLHDATVFITRACIKKIPTSNAFPFSTSVDWRRNVAIGEEIHWRTSAKKWLEAYYRGWYNLAIEIWMHRHRNSHQFMMVLTFKVVQFQIAHTETIDTHVICTLGGIKGDQGWQHLRIFELYGAIQIYFTYLLTICDKSNLWRGI